MKVYIVLSVVIIGSMTQRSSYAGRQPVGYPIIEPVTQIAAELANRFGDDEPATTITLLIEAMGDANLVRRLSKLPIGQQPFCLLNWRQLEENRNNPQTYPQKRNPFIDNNSSTKKP